MGVRKRENRTQKGCVATENHRNGIRLRWGYQGKRYYLYTGLPYTPAALKVAQQTAGKIELDMLTGHFDETLVAYPSSVTLRKHLLFLNPRAFVYEAIARFFSNNKYSHQVFLIG
jgi:integrase